LTASTPEFRTADASRYVFPVVALVLLVTVDGVRGLRLHRATLIVVFVVLAIAVPANLFHLVDARGYRSDDSRAMKAQFRMLELAGENADPTYVPGLESFEVSPRELIISAGGYLQTVDRIGSWAYTTEEVAEQGTETREAADAVLATALGVELQPARSPRDTDECETVEPTDEGVANAPLPPRGAVIETPEGGEVLLGRFGDQPTVDMGSVAPDSPAALEIPEDSATQEWAVAVAGSAPVTICPLSHSGSES
jgi:hypothetical protein